jgi:alkaline phosphatase
MPRYVDGFVLALPRKNVAAYQRISRRASVVWREHGALEYRECVGDDLNIKMGRPFPKIAGQRAGEVTVFSWIVYRSKGARDRANREVMKDPRIARMMSEAMPFDPKRMAMGGFKVIVDL